MKALTLWQPWASLVAIGAKRIETRTWSTPFRGRLAIHAPLSWSPTVVRWLRDCLNDPAVLLIHRLLGGAEGVTHLPLGVVIATVDLVDCRPAHAIRTFLSSQEALLGDYCDGRFGLILDNLVTFREPVPARGAQRFWEWRGEIPE